MDNNENVVGTKYNVDPTSMSVSASDESKNNERMIQELDANDREKNIRGYADANENLKRPVSNSLNEQTKNSNQPNRTQPNNQDPRRYPNTKLSSKNQNQNSNMLNRMQNSKSNSDATGNYNRKSNANSIDKNKNERNDAANLKQTLSKNAAKAAMMAVGIPSAAADAAADKTMDFTKKKKGIASRLLDFIGGGQEESEEQNEAKGKISSKVLNFIRWILAPASTFALTVIVIAIVLYGITVTLGLDPESAMDSSGSAIENGIDGYDDDDIDTDLEKLSNAVSYTYVNTNNSLYSIKLSTLAIKNDNKEKLMEEAGFDIEMMNEVYPSASEYADVEYADIFFYKLYRLNEYYKSPDVCGKQILNLPLLMITLKQQSDDMAVVFASNIDKAAIDDIYNRYTTDKSKKFTQYIIDEEVFDKYFAYDYDWSNYVYMRNSSIHDMEILAQHMVKVYGEGSCRYDDAGYKEFLNEFIEKKYFLSTDSDEVLTSNPNSSNYFQKYELTEFQLIEIANLCGREQGHSNPAGAAAEASLMANLYEERGSKFAAMYPNSNADALYYYVRQPQDQGGWWHDAAKFMSERKSTPEVIEAVRDVLVNGNRTLPKYVNSHDCFNCGKKLCPSGKVGDICEVKTNGVTYTTKEDVANRDNYIPHKTKVQNVYGSSYKTFYSFPSSAGDPFSYKDAKLREKYGECHYDFYKKEFVDCVDFRDLIVEWTVKIAYDNKHGYSQSKRDSLIDFDCSSLVYYALKNNGFTSGQLGSRPFTTRTEREILKKNGFTEIVVNEDCSNLQKGDILWRDGHTEIYVGEGMSVGAHSASNNQPDDNQAGDQNGKEIAVVNIIKGGYWTYAYRYEN